MAHAVFGLGRDLAESLSHSVGDEDWVVAEAMAAARRKFQMAMDFAAKGLDVRSRIGKRQDTDENAPTGRLRPSIRVRPRAMAAEKSLSGPAQRAE